MSVVYICSPYSAKTKEQFERQLQNTKDISKEVVIAGYEVITPHLYYTQFLDDRIESERKLGTESAMRLLSVCNAVFASIVFGVSKGMEAEIQVAKQKQMPIYYFRNMNELKDILKRTKGLI